MPKQAGERRLRVSYDCDDCAAFCCAIYERVAVSPTDVRRLARHFGTSIAATRRRFTKRWGRERILRRRRDPVFGSACGFLDPETRKCTIYDARPDICREYPGEPRCGYYDVLAFERRAQRDETTLPLIQLTFAPKR